MNPTPFVACYTGADPPERAARRAAENGIELVPLGEGDPSSRLGELRPDAYVMNDPDYGPYLSPELADAIGRLRIVVYHAQTTTAADYEPFMDVAALRERGIVLTTGPGTVTEAVSEATLALLLALNLNIARQRLLQSGRCLPARGPGGRYAEARSESSASGASVRGWHASRSGSA